MSNPRSWHTRAASAITAGSEPKSCAEMGCSRGSNARYLSVLVVLRAPPAAFTPCELVNSVISSPQPPRPRMNRRNTVSVTPAMGASTVAGETATAPMEKLAGKRCMELRYPRFHGSGHAHLERNRLRDRRYVARASRRRCRFLSRRVAGASGAGSAAGTHANTCVRNSRFSHKPRNNGVA